MTKGNKWRLSWGISVVVCVIGLALAVHGIDSDALVFILGLLFTSASAYRVGELDGLGEEDKKQ